MSEPQQSWINREARDTNSSEESEMAGHLTTAKTSIGNRQTAKESHWLDGDEEGEEEEEEETKRGKRKAAGEDQVLI